MKWKAFDKFRQIYYHITVNQNTLGEAVSRLRRKGEPIGNNVRSSFLFNTNKTRFRDVFQDAILRSFAPRSGVCYICVVNKQCFCALLVFILQWCNGLAPRSDMFYPCYTNGKCCQFVAIKRASLAEKYTFWGAKIQILGIDLHFWKWYNLIWTMRCIAPLRRKSLRAVQLFWRKICSVCWRSIR